MAFADELIRELNQRKKTIQAELQKINTEAEGLRQTREELLTRRTNEQQRLTEIDEVIQAIIPALRRI